MGPRLVALGNAIIAALGTMPGMDAVGQLALLKVKLSKALMLADDTKTSDPTIVSQIKR